MDYKALLKKYILHIRDHEGIDYISEGRLPNDMSDEIKWTDEEVKELFKLSEELKVIKINS